MSATCQTGQGQQCCARSTVVIGNGDALGTIATADDTAGLTAFS